MCSQKWLRTGTATREGVSDTVLGQPALAGGKEVKYGMDIPPPCPAWGLQTQHVLRLGTWEEHPLA